MTDVKCMNIYESVVFDSNILVYGHNSDSTFHNQALYLIKDVLVGNIEGVLTHQNLLEFYSIITDSKRVVKPLLPNLALDLVKQYLNSPFRIIAPNENTVDFVLSLSSRLNIKDGQIFDIYLVATMLSHKISTILTTNIKDFEMISSIKVIDLKTIK